jgi:hypothetical protein
LREGAGPAEHSANGCVTRSKTRSSR